MTGSGIGDSRLSVDDAIIAAARESIMEQGIRKTSIAEIARKAGVSRPTVYRRYADIGELTAEVLSRETLSTLEGLASLPGNARERILTRIRVVTDRIIERGLFAGLAETDPEQVLRLLTEKKRESHEEILRRFIVPGIMHGQEDGSIRKGDPMKLANGVFRLTQIPILVWKSVNPNDQTDTSLDDLVDFVDRYLRPNPEIDEKIG